MKKEKKAAPARDGDGVGEKQGCLFGETLEPTSPQVKAIRKAPKSAESKCREVDIHQVRSNPDRCRENPIDPIDDDTFVQSVRDKGVLQPILCIALPDGTFLIASGERRYAAAALADLEHIPIVIVEGNPLEIAIVENVMRKDLSAVALCEKLKTLKDQMDYSSQDLARICGKSEPTISQILSLMSLTVEVRDAVRNDEKFPRDVLIFISKLPEEEQLAYLHKYKRKEIRRAQLKRKSTQSRKRRIKWSKEVTRLSQQALSNLETALESGMVPDDELPELESVLEKQESRIHHLREIVQSRRNFDSQVAVEMGGAE